MPDYAINSQNEAAETRPVPSQAEGEDVSAQQGKEKTGNDTRPVPSQAEGDEETIDESLRQKERRG